MSVGRFLRSAVEWGLSGLALGGIIGCQTAPTPSAPLRIPEPLVQSQGASLELYRAPGDVTARTACAAVPLPSPGRNPDPYVELFRASARWGEQLVQAQVISGWADPSRVDAAAPAGAPRRVILRWIAAEMPERVRTPIAPSAAEAPDAGWAFSYRLIEGNEGQIPWRPKMRNVPLEETEYEMYQVDLTHGKGQVGLRMGLRHNDRIYWWQFVRADFVQRGPVFDLLRVGGPIYNEETTIQADVFLVLYANGLVEAYAHFINNQREGIGRDIRGIPVIAFVAPGTQALDEKLEGKPGPYEMGQWTVDLRQSAGYGTVEHPGSLRTEGGVVVLQPWEDQEVYGELLVEPEGIPEHRIVSAASRDEGDGFFVTKLGDRTIPKGMARSVRFTLSPAGTPPEIVRYHAPAWQQAQRGALPTKGMLPVAWWAVPRALEVGEAYFQPHPRHGAFELGCSARDSDGSLGSAMLLLGHATEELRYCGQAPLPAYWWADIAVDHVDFTVHELPKYSWQWIVQPYMRWIELVDVYHELGDPYLLETARHVADAYDRFFWTNRPHRFVGRDALGVADLLALYRSTGESVYAERARRILAEARRSYAQEAWYSPGHQSGCGTNGAARHEDRDYIPMLLARLHVQMIETGRLHREEEEEAWLFVEKMAWILRDSDPGGWIKRGISLSYVSILALAEQFPERAEEWLAFLVAQNAANELPDTHDGGKAYSWVTSALRFDSWAWKASWEGNRLRVRPCEALLQDPRAPKEAVVFAPIGRITVLYAEGGVSALDASGSPVSVEMLR